MITLSLLGGLASLGSGLLWAIALTIYVLKARDMPSDQINLFKNLIAFIGLLLFSLYQPITLPTDYRVVFSLVFAGLIGLALGDSLIIISMRYAGAQVSSALQCAVPMVSAIMAFAFLGEKLNTREFMGMGLILCGIVGVIFANNRAQKKIALMEKKMFYLGVLFALIAAFSQACSWVFLRFAMQNIDVYSGTVLRLGVSLIGLMLFQLHRHKKISIEKRFLSKNKFPALFVASIMGTLLSLLLITVGSKYTKAGVASALSSAYPIFMIPLAVYFLRERTNWLVILFTLVSIVGVAVMLV